MHICYGIRSLNVARRRCRQGRDIAIVPSLKSPSSSSSPAAVSITQPFDAAVDPFQRLLFWPATTSKRLRCRLAGSRYGEEFNNRGTEGIRKLLQDSDGWVLQPTFKAAHVGSIDASVSSEIFL
jgi:hypothetical protein